jgi:hypothetical protein
MLANMSASPSLIKITLQIVVLKQSSAAVATS